MINKINLFSIQLTGLLFTFLSIKLYNSYASTNKVATQTSTGTIVLGSTLIICQLLDGILTYFGVSLLGLYMEDNEFLKYLMQQWGIVPSILFSKIAAIFLCLILISYGLKNCWVQLMMLMVINFYVYCAIVPWILLIKVVS